MNSQTMVMFFFFENGELKTKEVEMTRDWMSQIPEGTHGCCFRTVDELGEHEPSDFISIEQLMSNNFVQ